MDYAQKELTHKFHTIRQSVHTKPSQQHLRAKSATQLSYLRSQIRTLKSEQTTASDELQDLQGQVSDYRDKLR